MQLLKQLLNPDQFFELTTAGAANNLNPNFIFASGGMQFESESSWIPN
jgi:hypothetical protein